MNPYIECAGLFAPSYLAKVIADPRGACPRVVPADIDVRLHALVDIWTRYRPSLIESAPRQTGLFTDLAETAYVGLPRNFRPLPKTQEAVAEGFVTLILEQVCGYHAEPKPPLNDALGGQKIIPDYVCFANQDVARRLRSAAKKTMPDARAYCADALLVVDAKRFGKGVGADETGDDQARTRGPKATRKEPSASEDVDQVLGYLRATGKRWGVLTNGRSWRLMETAKFEAHLRFDLVLFAEELLTRGGHYTAADRDTLTLFLYLFGPPATSGGYLDLLARESEVEIRRVRDVLRQRAHEAVSIVANGFLLHGGNGYVTQKGSTWQTPPQHELDAVRELSLVFLYRLLFALKAEAMNLLPMRDRHGAKTPYAKNASTEAIFQAVSNLTPYERTQSGHAFKMLRDLFKLIDEGGEYGVIAYNGGLFSAREHEALDRLRLHDDIIHGLLNSLIYLDAVEIGAKRSTVIAVPYVDLDVRDLGDVYEGLLELRLVREPNVPLDATGARPFVLRNQDGEKKASGSYFTPDAIVEHLVRQSLQPLLDACGKNAKAVLALKLIDPAMGSGHFLVKAVDIIAWYLTLHCDPLDAGVPNDNGPKELAYWKRRVVERCIYGVDVNPMAVELAKVALWLHTASEGKPLSFLDHHLKCGNALVGARLHRLNVPALTARATKKGDVWEPRSTGESAPRPKRKGASVAAAAPEQRALSLDVDTWWMQDILRRVAAIVAQPADTAADVHAKVRDHNDVESRLRCHRLLADLWCAQWLLVKPDANAVGVYENASGLYENLRQACMVEGPDGDLVRRDVYEQLADDPLVKTIQLAREEGYGPRLYRFFHWELEFPEMAFDAHGKRRDGYGFDVVVGNPPWNKLKPAKRDFYGAFSDDVANTQGPSLDKLIDRLHRERPELAEGWEAYQQQIETLVEYLGAVGDYTHQSVVLDGKKTGGDPDLFRFFLERAHQLAREGGRLGQVVPSTLWQAEGCTGLRKLLLDQCTMESLYGFENAKRWAFSIHAQFKFTTFVLVRHAPPVTHEFPAAFMLRDARIFDGGALDRIVALSRSFIDAVSPGTLALLDVKNDLEVKLVERLHEAHPALGGEKSGWGVKYRNELHMTNDAWMFRTREWMQARGFTQVMPVRDAGGSWTQRLDGPGDVAELPAELPAGGEYWVAASERYYRNRGYAERSGEIQGNTVRWFIHKNDVGKDEENNRIFASATYTALYDGRLIHAFDHCYQRYVSGEGPKQIWARLHVCDKRFASRVFVVAHEGNNPEQIRMGFRDIGRSSDERAFISAILPKHTIAGNTVPTLETGSKDVAISLVAIANSFVTDWLIRARIGAHLNWTFVRAIRVPYELCVEIDIKRILREHCARLSCTTPEMADVWTHVFPDIPWSYDVAERDGWKRGELRAEIDAIVADLYGLSVPEYAYILTTFPLLDRDQPPLPGDAFVTEGNEKSRGTSEERGFSWDESDEGIVELVPRSFVTRDLALLRYMQRKQYPIPADLETFYRDEVRLDPRSSLSRFRVGKIRDLETRVLEAQKLGAMAYVPSGRGGGGDEE